MSGFKTQSMRRSTRRKHRLTVGGWVLAVVLATATPAFFRTRMVTLAAALEVVGSAKDQNVGQQENPSDASHSSILSTKTKAKTLGTEEEDWPCTCLGRRSSTRKKRQFQQNATRQQTPPYATTTSHDNKDGARILYLITVHNARTMEDAVHLFRTIRDARNTVLIHVDSKLEWRVYEESQLYQELQHCHCGSTVVVESLFDCKWGSWSMNLPTIWAMQTGILKQIVFDVFINLSGDTVAVLKPNAMAQLLAGPLANTNFCTSSACETGLRPTHILEFPPHWHKYGHYNHGKPLVIQYNDEDENVNQPHNSAPNIQNATLHIHFGSQWMTVTREFCEWLVRSLHHPTSLASRFRDALIERQYLMTDETFFTTLLVHKFPDTLPHFDETSGNLMGLPYPMTAIRYERMDEHLPTSIHGYYPIHPRYQVPDDSLGVVDEPRVWGPYYLGIYDAWDIRQSGALFCRKVSSMVDENLMKILPVDHHDQIPPIQWPKYGVSISELPNWEKDKARYIQQAMDKEEQEKTHDPNGVIDEPDQEQQAPSEGSPIADRDDMIASDL